MPTPPPPPNPPDPEAAQADLAPDAQGHALLARVAHELNTPLAIVLARASLLQRRSDDPRVQADAQKIHDAAVRCSRILQRWLAATPPPPEN